jgi:hypothetical protein
LEGNTGTVLQLDIENRNEHDKIFYDRSAEDAYSSMASDPTFDFLGGHVALRPNLYNVLDCGHGDHIVNFHTLMLLKIRHDRVFLV